ncbi:PREDICTED: ADP-ribosylation factor-like protein 6 [Amphimedon queenslandica]|uniref:ADP-ribosylation factor-like protein 6 n=1 Tax=Amphimedon queenslandica TaxID=400682 RepID=A0A1X7V131_AMPQE|nr:PREDICTED: ADP-ribosylation factor-like protein 6 [Amphimedon queenslandica]|eukprot:XP_003386141.1 PREDICTED: ADP-ribosylation factor-like protein 6 [Amphimedon queenslandica]
MDVFKRLATWLGITNKKATVLCVGLDNSGKTTVINHFKPPQTKSEEVVPTIGYSVEKFLISRISFTVFDMSGQGRYRNLWEQYYPETEAVIFVIDSSERLRLEVAREELHALLEHPVIKQKRIPICCLANKKDLKDALSDVEIADKMELAEIADDKPYNIFATNARTGEGLDMAMDWLSEQIMTIK